MAQFVSWMRRLATWLDGRTTAINTRNARSETQGPKPPSSTRTNAASGGTFHWPEHDDCMEVVGESFYQDDLKHIAGEHGRESARKEVIALIRPDNDNPHDDKAVSIWVHERKVGHLSRDDARSFRRRLAAKKLSNQATTCSARVVGGHLLNGGSRASYGLLLYIKPFD